MAAPKRSKIQRERDKLTISELHLKGWSQQRIADFLELDKSGISRELKRIKSEWKQETIEDHNLYIQQELRRLAMLEAEYWNAWERSQQGKETSLIEKLATGRNDLGEAMGRIKSATRVEQKVGDAVFLAGIQKVIDTRSKLLGLYQTDDQSASQGSAEQNLKGYLAYLEASNANGNQHKPV